MGLIYADIELINGGDIEMARRYIIGEEEIKRMSLRVLVDTGSYMLCINKSIQEQLQFPVVEKRKAQLANSEIVECDVVSMVELKFKNRRTMCNAMVCCILTNIVVASSITSSRESIRLTQSSITSSRNSIRLT